MKDGRYCSVIGCRQDEIEATYWIRASNGWHIALCGRHHISELDFIYSSKEEWIASQIVAEVLKS